MGSTCPLSACSKCPNPLREMCHAYQEEGKRGGGHTEVETKEKQTLKYDQLSSL